MQHDYFKKSVFWLRVCLCYHVEACVIPFNLICNMTILHKKYNFGLSSTPLVHLRGKESGLQTKILFDRFHIYCSSACMNNFGKNIDNWLSYCEILIFDLPLKGQRGGLKFFTLPCLSKGIGIHGLW